MQDEAIRLIQHLVKQEQARLQAAPARAPGFAEPAGIPFTALPSDDSNEPLAQEWNVYRREIGRLLAEGHQGRFVLIRGEEIVGLYDDWSTARQAGWTRFGREPFFVHAIREVEPHLHIRGINRPWLA
jgi:hypothetical protein